MENKRAISPEIVFAEQPALKAYFKDIDGRIRGLKKQEGKKEELNRLKKKRTALYETAKYMGSEELQILYYLRQLKSIAPHHVLTALKKLVEAQEELKSCIEGGKLRE